MTLIGIVRCSVFSLLAIFSRTSSYMLFCVLPRRKSQTSSNYCRHEPRCLASGRSPQQTIQQRLEGAACRVMNSVQAPSSHGPRPAATSTVRPSREFPALHGSRTHHSYSCGPLLPSLTSESPDGWALHSLYYEKLTYSPSPIRASPLVPIHRRSGHVVEEEASATSTGRACSRISAPSPSQ